MVYNAHLKIKNKLLGPVLPRDKNQTKILFDTISGENSDKIPLIDQVLKSSISVKTSDGSFVNHPIYTLVAREGIGQSPSSVDSTYVSYEGLLLNKSSFAGISYFE